MTIQQDPRSERIVIVGGGIAGLVAATRIARGGRPVLLLEKASAPGGRAATREKHGYLFNLGPHALYRHGALRRTLASFGIDPKGSIPGGNGGFALYRGRRYTLPTGFASLVTTGLLDLAGKFEFAKLLASIGSIDASAVQKETLASWLEHEVRDRTVRELVKMLVRVTTFTNDPEHQSAGAALEQLQLGAAGNVLYLDGGWQTIVNALRSRAVEYGVTIRTGAHVVALEPRGAREAGAVRLAGGDAVQAGAVILTGAPTDVDEIARTSFGKRLPRPVRLATLDLALRTLPKPGRIVAFGVDVPLYFSVHSSVAKLAPSGCALLHASKYLGPGEVAGAEVERELEGLVDDLQPGWRHAIDSRQYLPNLIVTHSQITAAQGGIHGRPGPRLEGWDNVFIAGDWVGCRGQLSDAAAASAAEAADAVTEGRASAQPFPAAVGA